MAENPTVCHPVAIYAANAKLGPTGSEFSIGPLSKGVYRAEMAKLRPRGSKVGSGAVRRFYERKVAVRGGVGRLCGVGRGESRKNWAGVQRSERREDYPSPIASFRT